MVGSARVAAVFSVADLTTAKHMKIRKVP